jgi:hypothetical protein
LLLLCLLHQQVKAKVIRSYVDKMITLAKDGSLHARRQVRSAAVHLVLYSIDLPLHLSVAFVVLSCCC